MTIEILEEKRIKFEGVVTRTARIAIELNGQTYEWFVGGLPIDGDLQPRLDANEAQYFAEASARKQPLSPEEKEVATAPLTARGYFRDRSAALDFIRLTPADQEAAIDAMTTAQLKEVVKYLAIAVSALVKERYL